MGNCQAIDAATLVIQHPCGKVDKLYWPVTACEIMKMNPGHYVALLITTTLYKSNGKPDENSSGSSNSNDHNSRNNRHKNKEHNSSSNRNNHKHNNDGKDNNSPRTTATSSSSSSNSLRVTRVKLLRPTDTLTLGHVYRLISTQEVMKGLVAKKQAKLKKQGIEFEGKMEENTVVEKVSRRPQLDKNNQVLKPERHRSRTSGSANGGQGRSKIWQPRLQSISEAAS